jgi:hypothetical protein
MSSPDLPAAPASRVLLAQRRDAAIALLGQRFAEDLLEVDELEARLDLAHRATTLAELERVVADLEPPAPAPAPGAAIDAPTALALTRDDPTRAETRSLWAVFGGLERKGRWQVPRRLAIRCVMGGAELDFREADFGPGVTELRLHCLMGGVDIVVPPWLQVDVDMSAILGGVDNRSRVSPEPDAGRPILRITGLAMMGGVDVKTRLPGESWRDARRREKAERAAHKARAKALDKGGSGALPPGGG